MEMAKLRKIRSMIVLNLIIVTLLVLVLVPMATNSQNFGRYQAYGELCGEEQDLIACDYSSESRHDNHHSQQDYWLFGVGGLLIINCIINLVFLYKNAGTVIHAEPIEIIKEVRVEVQKEVIKEVPVEIIREIIREVPTSSDGNIVINVDGKKVILQDSVYTEK
jgi:hypothetical protein